jgi:hypothetical protein
MYKVKRFARSYIDPIRWDDHGIKDIDTLVEYSKKYESDMKDLSVLMYSKKIRLLIRDIRGGFMYEDGPNGGETHMLSDYNKKNKFLLYSKKVFSDKGVDTYHRVNYAIYKPEIIEADSSKRLIFKIVIQSVKGHELLGRKGYSEMED